METLYAGHLPFLDIDICRRLGGSLGYTVYKVTNPNLYLNAKSHHHMVNKHSVLSPLAYRVRAICFQLSHRRIRIPS